ncbi:uncharacterized protein T551_01350 [Pneumocystis jirovecii RU7]|uniref:Uncharacterized protein n=1 Tax=Pneumocystis jirovecii (strain RU7) TaxID=1408657 RepID=A0A0W4ZSF0_PNEJ7|nr:uncharacterized protein T551_01350 [Pneumocystis jirovecii RU7]KTW31278.1 hypothetical protein T551_01350 [Pneumocystis jirovecii RU7]
MRLNNNDVLEYLFWKKAVFLEVKYFGERFTDEIKSGVRRIGISKIGVNVIEYLLHIVLMNSFKKKVINQKVVIEDDCFQNKLDYKFKHIYLTKNF